MTNQEKILNILADGEFHCLTKELFMKDDRARISGLRKKGYEFDSPRCDGRCGMEHGSAVVMRRLVQKVSVCACPPQEILQMPPQQKLFTLTPVFNHE